jgi:pimeloyl-ACP methyl ester carboxylesterase
MITFRSAMLFLAAAATVCAQLPTPDQQPDTQAMVLPLRTLLRNSPAAESLKAQVSKLMDQAGALQNAGQIGEMRRVLAHAITLFEGQSWGPAQEFAWSLALRPDRVVTEPASPLMVRLSQFYSCPYKPAGALELRASLVNAGSGNAPVRQLGVYPISTRDWIDQPFGFDTSLEGVAEGAYQLRVELLDGGAVMATVASPINLVQGILSDRARIEGRLARIPGHESTKASLRNPYVLAETVNIGRRHLNQADFGIPFTPQPLVYDFHAGVRQSAELLKALEAGQDPLWRAKGDHERHYWFEAAREMMPYRVYVPEKWDRRSKLPMVLILHGATRDDNFYFDRDGHILTKLAEQHGYLVVCPFGYRPTGGWGASAMMSGGEMDAARLRQTQWSEQDALNVYDLVTKEYPIDTSRVYLFGHSMGGTGAWYFGQKFRERWAAVVSSAAAINRPEVIPYERLKDVPLMVVVGDKDPLAAGVRATIKYAREHGLNPEYVEVPGATHETIVALIEPRVFDFFDRHVRK